MDPEKIKQLKSDNSEIKISAVESLNNSELDEETIDFLCSQIAEQDKGLRNALLFLFTNNNNPLIPSKIVPFIKSKEASTRNFAGVLLLRIGSPAADAMIEFLDKGDHDDIKFIIDILGLIGDKKSVSKILGILQENRDDNIILACIEALGNICESPINSTTEDYPGEPLKNTAEKIIDALLDFYTKNELYRPTIIESLGKMGNVLNSSSRDKVIEFVHSRYDSEEELTKLSITECLGKIGCKASLLFLLQKLEQAEGLLIWETVKSLAELKERTGEGVFEGEKLYHAILNTLVEGESKHKMAAVKILPSIDSKVVMINCLKLLHECPGMDDPLKPRLFEKPEMLYEASAELLSSEGSEKKAVLMLLSEFWGSSEEEKLKFKSWKGRLAVINSLVNCIESTDEELRINALELLFEIDSLNSVYFMEEFIEDPSIWNRLKVLDMLEKIIHPKADKILGKLLSDEDEMVSTKAKNIINNRNTAVLAGDSRN